MAERVEIAFQETKQRFHVIRSLSLWLDHKPVKAFQVKQFIDFDIQ